MHTPLPFEVEMFLDTCLERKFKVSIIQQQESALVVRSSVFRTTVFFLIDKLTVIAISYDVAWFTPIEVNMCLDAWIRSDDDDIIT